MANLTVSVRRVGNDLVVSGSAIAAVTITCGADHQTVSPDASGAYTATFPGLANTTNSITVDSSTKTVSVELTADVETIETAFSLLALESVKVKRMGNNKIELSGKFAAGFPSPTAVNCTRVATGEVKSGTVNNTNKKWSVSFDNCPGGGHKFKLD